jgi:transcriptional regulator with XRE-family HTH domain
MSAEVVPIDSPTYGELVAAEVRAQAARKRITGARLAAATDMGPMSMSRRITGRQAFDVDELAAVAAVLGVRVQDLLPPPRELLPHLDSNQKPADYQRGMGPIITHADWEIAA